MDFQTDWLTDIDRNVHELYSELENFINYNTMQHSFLSNIQKENISLKV